MPEDEFQTWLEGLLRDLPAPAWPVPEPDLIMAKISERQQALLDQRELLKKYQDLPDGSPEEDVMQEHDPIPARALSAQEERDARFEDRQAGILARHEARMERMRDESRHLALIAFAGLFIGMALMAVGAFMDQRITLAAAYCLGAAIALFMVLVVTRRPTPGK